MAANKVQLSTGEVLVDLTADTVTSETLAEGETAHDASGQSIIGKMPTATVLYTPQTLTEKQKTQARQNIGAVSADETPKVFYITMNPADMTVDKTDAEIEAAYQAGKHLVCRFPYDSPGFLQYINCPLSIRLELDGQVVGWVFSMAGLMPGTTNPSAGYFVVAGGKVENFDIRYSTTQDDIPTELPNPYALTFRDSNNNLIGTYDGSTNLLVKIPSKTPNPYALTINGTSYDGSKAVNLTIEGGSGGESIPEYVRTEAERVAALVQSHQSANTLSILACSDIHLPVSTHVQHTDIKNGLVHAGQAMKVLRDQVHFDFAFCGGDMIWDNGETNATAVQSMRFVHEVLADGMQGISFWAEGNHDDGHGSGANLTTAQTFSNIGAWNSGAVYNPEDRNGGYCYRDFEDYKVRVICLNTSRGKNDFSSKQCQWLTEALNVPVKEGWGTILLSHCPLDWNNGSSSQTTNVMSVIKAASGIICTIHGHTHCYKIDKLTGTDIPKIAVPNICFSRNNEYGELGNTAFGETTTSNKTAGTANDTAFAVITVDRESGSAYVDYYGARPENTRTVTGMPTWKKKTYTNLVPKMQVLTAGSTAAYNGTGYKNGVYASSTSPYESGDSECVTTGLMPYGTGVTTPIYIKGVTIDTSKSHCRIHGFSADKTLTIMAATGSALNTYFTIETLGDQYYKVTPTASWTGVSGGYADYLRFSLIGTGENLVITLDEPID